MSSWNMRGKKEMKIEKKTIFFVHAYEVCSQSGDIKYQFPYMQCDSMCLCNLRK